MKYGDYIKIDYKNNDYDWYSDYKSKPSTSLSDVKDYVSKIDKISEITQVLDSIDENIIQNYIREKKIIRIKNKINK